MRSTQPHAAHGQRRSHPASKIGSAIYAPERKALMKRRWSLNRRASFVRPVLVHLRRQADQVSDDHECANGNESGHADGEQNPKKMDLLGAEVEAAHCSSAGQAALRSATQRDIAVERRRPSQDSGPAPLYYPPVAGASAAVLF